MIKMLILAAVQGLTEFLPVSSSGHIVILKGLIGMDADAGPSLEILLHAGTLVAVMAFYWRRIWELIVGVLRGDRAAWSYGWRLVLATIPAGVVYLALDDYIDRAFGAPLLVAVLMMFTGVILLSTRLVWNPEKTEEISFGKSFLTGLAQAVAILPGVSRSGSTIAAAKWLKVSTKDAFDFSFLMSVPILLAGIVLKAKHIGELCRAENGGALPLCMAFATSAVVGYFSLKLVVKCGIGGKFWLFGFYCLAAGGILTLKLLLF